MKKEDPKAIRVNPPTHKRFKVLAAQAGKKHDDFANILMDTYERSYALSRGFAKRTERETELT